MGVSKLARIVALPERRVIGLNSGTSMDGIDAALVQVAGYGDEVKFGILSSLTVPYPDSLRRSLLQAPSIPLEEVTRLHVHLGELFARAAAEVAAAGGVPVEEVDLVGSHGQTICHVPGEGPGRGAATLQVGDLDVIAERVGAPVFGDFRMRDIAAGGEGAPLMPWLDWLLFRTRPRTVVLNLGGIAAVTGVTEDFESCQAFDAGPCNLPLDLLADKLSGGTEAYDPGGRMAAEGTVDPILLDRLMAHPFLQRPPPRTSGREMFGSRFVDDLVQRTTHVRLQDVLATCCEFVARSIHQAVVEHLRVPGGPREIVASGGGIGNLTLMRRLKQLFSPVPVTTSGDHGLDPDAKEALLFALLANEALGGGATNAPRSTGARWPVSLGKVAF